MINPSQKMIILSLAAVTVFAAGLIWSGKATLNDGFVSSAEARIGRPLTPMSYAGVARRTTRRAVAYGAAGAAAVGAAAYAGSGCVQTQVTDVYGRISTVCQSARPARSRSGRRQIRPPVSGGDA